MKYLIRSLYALGFIVMITSSIFKVYIGPTYIYYMFGGCALSVICAIIGLNRK